MRKKVIILFLIVLGTSKVFSQLTGNEANYWYFSDHAGLNFNILDTNNHPAIDTNGIIDAFEGSCVMSDGNGNLLFYSNGEVVVDRTHHVMPHGDNFLGGGQWSTPSSANQACIAVKKPSSDPADTNIYYIFMNDCKENNCADGFRYTKIDMSLNGGLGDVDTTEKDVVLFAPGSEALAVVNHANNIDAWAVTKRGILNQYYAYKITAAGVDTVPVISVVGDTAAGRNVDGINFSPDGKFAAVNYRYFDVVDSVNKDKTILCKFNNATGELTYYCHITYEGYFEHEFSPNSKYLYILEYDYPHPIYQYEITLGDTNLIQQSRELIGYADGRLQLAPNCKIYLRDTWGHIASCINAPNAPDSASCDFVHDALDISPGEFELGFPNFNASIFNFSCGNLAFYYHGECLGEELDFHTINISPYDSIRWNFDDIASGSNNTSTELNTTHVFTSPGLYEVELTKWYQSEPYSVTQYVNIVPCGLNVNISADNSSICLGESVTLTQVTGGGSTPYSYEWSTGDTTEGPITITPTNSGVLTYSITVTDADGSTDSASVDINVHSNPSVVASADTNIICPPETATLSAEATGGAMPYTYNWSPADDLDDATNQYPVASPTNIGENNTYTVTVTDANGCESTASTNVLVACGPVPVLTIVPDTICMGGSAKMTLSVSGGTQPYEVPYEWNNDEITIQGTTDGLNIPPFDVTPTGTTTYCVTVTDANGIEGVDCVTITVLPLPNAVVEAGDTVICAGESVNLDASSSIAVPPANIVSWEWSNGVNEVSQEVSPTTTTTYTVTVTDDNSCANTDDVTITVNELPVITAINIDSLKCYGDSNATIAVTISGQNDFVYTWTNNGNVIKTTGPTSLNTDTLSGEPVAVGDYLFEVTDANNCKTDSVITIVQPDELSVSLTKTDVSCFGYNDGQITTEVTGGNSPYTYEWEPTHTGATLSNLSAGTYSLTVQDVNGCEAYESTNITEPTAITIESATVTDANCYGSTDASISQIISGGAGNYSFIWSNESTSQDLNNIGAGIYQVTIIDENNCTKDTSYTISQPSEIVITDSIYIQNEKGYIDIYVNGGTPDYTYNWSNGETSQNIGNLLDGIYVLEVSDSRNCSTVDTFVIKLPLFIPTVITPNRDGYNDTWNISGLSEYNNVELNIFNRWGDKVYTYSGSGNEYATNPSKQWDGTWNGEELPFWNLRLGNNNFRY